MNPDIKGIISDILSSSVPHRYRPFQGWLSGTGREERDDFQGSFGGRG